MHFNAAIARQQHIGKQLYYDNRKDLEDFISGQMLATRNWRNQQSKRFPDDARNRDAADKLQELESRIDITEEEWKRLAPLPQTSSFLTAISATNRAVGFRSNPRNFSGWLDNLHFNLARV